MRKLQNFVGGAYRDAEDGPTATPDRPEHGRAVRRGPGLGAGRRRPGAARWRPRPSPSWKRTTPSERSLALIRIADALEARAEDLVRAE